MYWEKHDNVDNVDVASGGDTQLIEVNVPVQQLKLKLLLHSQSEQYRSITTKS